jgi:hypothetical protein
VWRKASWPSKRYQPVWESYLKISVMPHKKMPKKYAAILHYQTSQVTKAHQLTGRVCSGDHLRCRRLREQDCRQPLTAPSCQPAVQAHLRDCHHCNFLRLLYCLGTCGGSSPYRGVLAVQSEQCSLVGKWLNWTGCHLFTD